MAIAQTVLTTIGSTAAVSLLTRLGDRGKNEIENSIFTGLRLYLLHHFWTQLTMSIEEFDGLVPNELYTATKLYLSTKINPECNHLKAHKSQKEKDINVAMGYMEEIYDIYNGAEFKWVWLCKKSEMREYHDPSKDRTHYRSKIQTFEVTFHKKHKDMAVEFYFPFILKQAQTEKQSKKNVKMFTLSSYEKYSYTPRTWTSVPLNHPATFDTLAMEPDMKEKLLNDLDMFVKRSEKYKKVGKTWKRGYLLYGPPGTGKSSLVAAMANYLGFDVYDLELNDLKSNSELRQLLVSTTDRSILLVEDIDCSAELHDRAKAAKALPLPPQPDQGHRDDEKKKKVTLSGFLNFTDGLWSSCGDERIIIFTTNHKEMLDPALLRPGRMDVHIHMSYCTPSGFKILAKNYHEIEDHAHFEEIENLIENLEVTPAEVAEQLLKNDSADIAMEELIKFLHEKKEEKEKVEVKKDNIEKVEKEGGGKKKKIMKMFKKALLSLLSHWRCFGVCFLFFVTWMVILGAAKEVI